MRDGIWVHVEFPQGSRPHVLVEANAGWGDDSRRKCPEEEVGGGYVTEAEDGEGVLSGHGGMGENLENARVLVKIGDGEGGESVTIQTDGRAEDGEDSSVVSVFVGPDEGRDDWWRRCQLRPKHTTFVGCQFEVELSEKGDEARDHCGGVLGEA